MNFSQQKNKASKIPASKFLKFTRKLIGFDLYKGTVKVFKYEVCGVYSAESILEGTCPIKAVAHTRRKDKSNFLK